MNFCSQCGQPVSLHVPEGDNRPRFVCTACHKIHYENPRIVTGCLAVKDEGILLCKRSIQPRKGLWTLPAGFLENGETTTGGALREMLEEANARAEIENIYTIFNLPHISQVYMFFLAHLTDGDFAAGDESEEVKLFEECDIPWDQLAFPVVEDTLRFYFADRKVGTFPTRVLDILYKPGTRERVK